MEINELIETYSEYLEKINDLWRSLWPREKTSTINRIRTNNERE